MENGVWKFVKSVGGGEKFNINLEINHISTILCYHPMCHRADPVCPSSVPPTPPPLPFRIAPRFKATIPPTGISFHSRLFFIIPSSLVVRPTGPIFTPHHMRLVCAFWLCLACVCLKHNRILFTFHRRTTRRCWEEKRKVYFRFFFRARNILSQACVRACVKIVTTRLS